MCGLVHKSSVLKWSFVCTVEEDAFDVITELTPVAARWKAIGMALRLTSGKLDRIESSHPGKPTECLSDVILEWLKRNYNVEKFGEPSWKWVVEVVASPVAGNDTALADKIASKHPGLKKHGKSSVTYFGVVTRHLAHLLAIGTIQSMLSITSQFVHHSRVPPCIHST